MAYGHENYRFATKSFKTCAGAYGIHAVFQTTSRGLTHFLPTAVKSKQKGPLSGQLTYPI